MDRLITLTKTLTNHLRSLDRISSSRTVEELLQSIQKIIELLPGPLTIQKIVGIDYDHRNWLQYIENHYSLFLHSLISKFDQNFILTRNVTTLFIVENCYFFCETFQTLIHALKHSNTENSTIIINILHQQLRSKALLSSILFLTLSETQNDEILQNEIETKWSTTIQMLVSLPNRISNHLKTEKAPKIFTTDNFCSVICFNITEAILILTECRKRSITIKNIKPLTELFSKTIIALNNKINSKGYEYLIKVFETLCNSSEEAKYIIQLLFNNLNNRNCIEIITILLLKTLTPRKTNLVNILSNIVTNHDWEYVLCTKIPLLTYYNEKSDNLTQNLIIYLCECSVKSTETLVTNLLNTWSNKFSINHTSYEQHLYITKFIVLTVKYLTEFNIKLSSRTSGDLQGKLIHGIPIHLESPNVKIRVIGMATGEIVLNYLKKYTETQNIELKFEYNNFPQDAQDLEKELKNVTVKNEVIFTPLDIDEVSYKICVDSGIIDGDNTSLIQVSSSANLKVPKKEPDNLLISKTAKKNDLITIIDPTDFELDSDDDLEPYNMSNDTKYTKKTPPAYLRDLRDGLLDSEDPEIFAMSIESAERLITNQLANDDVTLGLELLEILMTLEPKFYVENFDNLVFNSAVGIAAIYPKESAECLCKNFHANIGTFTISQRVFMLDVLAESARILSSAKVVASNATNQVIIKKKQSSSESAESVIRKRIESKTRRFFSSKFEDQLLKTKLNKFANVAGSFFFPLVYGFRSTSFITFSQSPRYDTDYILLVHFLQTLAILMCASQNLTLAPRMAKEILNLTFAIRFHPESKVRLVVLNLLAAVIINVPKTILRNELLPELMEIRLWLSEMLHSGISNTEIDTECRIVGGHVLCLIENAIKIDLNEVLY